MWLFTILGETEGRKFDCFDAHGWYNEGNYKDLQVVLNKLTGKDNPKVPQIITIWADIKLLHELMYITIFSIKLNVDFTFL